jgi:hypothetical protein
LEAECLSDRIGSNLSTLTQEHAPDATTAQPRETAPSTGQRLQSTSERFPKLRWRRGQGMLPVVKPIAVLAVVLISLAACIHRGESAASPPLVPEPLVAPDLIGMDGKTAVRGLAEAGLCVKEVLGGSSGRPVGTVLDQSPEPGQAVSHDVAFTLWVVQKLEATPSFSMGDPMMDAGSMEPMSSIASVAVDAQQAAHLDCGPVDAGRAR